MTALPPAPCHPASQGVIPQVSCPYSNTNEIFLFLLFCLALLDQCAVTTASESLKGRGYNRASATFCLCVGVLCVHSPFGSRRSCSYPARWQQLVISALTSCMA